MLARVHLLFRLLHGVADPGPTRIRVQRESVTNLGVNNHRRRGPVGKYFAQPLEVARGSVGVSTGVYSQVRRLQRACSVDSAEDAS